MYISQTGATYRYLINNANFESYIKVIKTDAETGKVIPYASAAFEIYNPDGSKVEMTYTYPTPTTIDVFLHQCRRLSRDARKAALRKRLFAGRGQRALRLCFERRAGVF